MLQHLVEANANALLCLWNFSQVVLKAQVMHLEVCRTPELFWIEQYEWWGAYFSGAYSVEPPEPYGVRTYEVNSGGRHFTVYQNVCRA